MKYRLKQAILIILIQLFFLVSIIVSLYFYSLNAKKNAADIIIKSVHNSILTNDFRQTGLILNYNVPYDFIKIIIINNKNQIIYETGLIPNESISNLNTFKKGIYLSEASNNPNFSLFFSFSIIQILKNSFSIFVLFLCLTIPGAVLLIIRLEKINKSKIEREKKISIQIAALQMSHDIRSPLATLNSISENLQGKTSEDLKLLKLSIDRINQISNSLLEQGKEQTNIKFELIKTISNLVELKKAEYKNAKINLKYDQYKSIKIEGNLIEFERMFSNLVNNAIEASNTPIVEIILDIVDSKLKLAIKDNGKGIPKNVLEQIGKHAITTKEKGNGLGLSHAIKTAESFNAKINFESTSSGTTVSLAFQNFEIDQLNAAIKYVLVDDDQLVQLTWKARAAKCNVDLTIFTTADELKNKLDELNNDSTFYIDRELGETNGEDLAIFLNQKGFQNLFLATGHSPDSFAHLSFLKGVIGKKPPF